MLYRKSMSVRCREQQVVYFVLAIGVCLLLTMEQVNGERVRRDIPPTIPQERLWAVIPNDTYGLDCFLYGEPILVYDVKGTLTVEPPFFDDILLYERSSGNMIWYEPLIHDPTLNFPRCNADVWSPNHEYFVLAPSGSAGFSILHTSNVFKTLNTEDTGFLRLFISGKSLNTHDLEYWHTFWKWVGDDAFLLSVSHAYDHHQYVYEIGTHKLFSLSPFANSTAVTEQGELRIETKREYAVLDDHALTQLTVGMTRGMVLLRCGEPVSPHHLPVWLYPSKDGSYHHIFYFWPTNETEDTVGKDDKALQLVAITKLTLEDRGYASDERAIQQESYIFPDSLKGKQCTGLKRLQIMEMLIRKDAGRHQDSDCP